MFIFIVAAAAFVKLIEWQHGGVVKETIFTLATASMSSGVCRRGRLWMPWLLAVMA
ncbi:hypothetical protein [Pectobacterium aroidearum]|uniref:hypothetical protein n=1 Tax=Pectobacterium aroidearum TaxID=1201031 RepID=UPI002113D3BC|nr:hypothetical protein [Pectobacterium aroidearum]UUE56107.1 hypothetical protein L0Y27_12750 [Pectobacterium aroidearum]UUE68767.1 hypothetical protein L0Y21_13420 [Pectobacterium aroidearum]UUE73136.1 hypothetical protein L0Y20_13525 [Pectobacterium aroidearum]UUE77476.1 hypothetical protein L0Y24_12965 [Pectobacterium aroidearum]